MRNLRLRYSLRLFLLLLTAVAIWFGIRASAANSQRRAVEVITAAGGEVLMDWQLQPVDDNLQPTNSKDFNYIKIVRDPEALPAPSWLRRIVGDDYFQTAAKVNVHPDKVDAKVAGAIQGLPKLTNISLKWFESEKPKLTPAQYDELVDQLEKRNPQASVWSPDL